MSHRPSRGSPYGDSKSTFESHIQTRSDAEVEAGAGTRLLTHTDTLPQSIYYVIMQNRLSHPLAMSAFNIRKTEEL